MMVEPPMLLPLYKIFLETLVNNLVVLYLGAFDGFACFKQKFGGLDDVVWIFSLSI